MLIGLRFLKLFRLAALAFLITAWLPPTITSVAAAPPEEASKDDNASLRELSLKIIDGALSDMREQMRGAAVTALKEMGGPESLPLLEKGLADQSALLARKEAWADAYRHTPHGKPVELKGD